MNHEFGNIGRRLPYDLPEHRLEALHERILRNTAARPAPAARTRRLYLAAGVSVAAALLATGILLSGHLSHRAEAPLPDIEQMLARLKDRELPPPPAATMCGALLDYITTPNKDFQPMGANMGILPRTEEINAIRDKRERYMALSQNAQDAMRVWTEEYK